MMNDELLEKILLEEYEDEKEKREDLKEVEELGVDVSNLSEDDEARAEQIRLIKQIRG